jgi:hypothetical protein
MTRGKRLETAIRLGDIETVEWIVESGGAAISDENISLAERLNYPEIVALLRPIKPIAA